ncbi:MAG: hypothetical protein ACFB5Z_01190 [Elainellaceae cyanobacterium]
MTQLQRFIEAILTAIALTAAVSMQFSIEDPFEQVLSSIDTVSCTEASAAACSPKLASTWQFFNPF